MLSQHLKFQAWLKFFSLIFQMPSFTFPSKRGNFYILNGFFGHAHNAMSASCMYAFPWENFAILVPKRDEKKAGCVGCVVRRLIATTYHRKEKIHGVDSIWCNIEEFEKKLNADKRFEQIKDVENSSTKCFLFEFETEKLEEIHVLPAPSCACSRLTLPSLSSTFVQTWLQKWPNVIIQKTTNRPYYGLHLYSAKLPNVVPIFVSNRTSSICVPTAPTVTSLRDESDLSKRLLGESIERYVIHYVPLDRLFTSPEDSSALKPMTNDLTGPLWTKVVNTKGQEVFCKADEVFSGLNKLYSSQFHPLSSSGVAAHSEVKLAKTNALLELIERDSLLVAWRLANHELSPFRDLPASLSETREKKWVQKLLSKQEQELVLCSVVNQFNLPIILAMGLPQSAACRFAPNFGSGIAFSWEIAYKKALKELLQGVAIPDLEICKQLPTSFIERPRFWAEPKRQQILRKKISPKGEAITYQDLFSLDDLLRKFDILKLPLYFADLTTPDISLSGWNVIRAMCPFFEKFVGNANHEQPNLDRINFFLKSMNVNPIDFLNLDPFPFP